MSWQCPKCETVNQDVTPVCTVCDTLAPVIESFLSLESIEDLREYNSKLDEVHRLEISGDYDRMLDVALEAIAIYKENGIAVDKAKQALKRSNEVHLINHMTTLLNSAIDKKNYLEAIAVIGLIKHFNLEISNFVSIKSEIESQLEKEKYIDNILKVSYKAIVQLKLEEASKVVEIGLKKYPSCEFLQQRKDEIKALKTRISNFYIKEDCKKKPFKSPKHQPISISDTHQPSPEVTTLGEKNKYPKNKKINNK